jgi:uncharacterized lipoprotein YajG
MSRRPGERVARLADGGRVVAVHADQVALRVETVHLDQRLAQVAGAVGDDRDEVVVVLDLRPLVEFPDVLQAVREQQMSSHGFHGAKAARRRVLTARR